MQIARGLLVNMSEVDVMNHLQGNGLEPAESYLIVKAAKILREPYKYVESKSRMIYYENHEK